MYHRFKIFFEKEKTEMKLYLNEKIKKMRLEHNWTPE